jgi:hypothetical protein
MNNILPFLNSPLTLFGSGFFAAYVSKAIFDWYKRRSSKAAERLVEIRTLRLTSPSTEIESFARTLSLLRAYAFISRLDVLANRRLLWSFTIVMVETVLFTMAGNPSGWLAIAAYIAGTTLAVGYMLSAFAMTRRATAEYRALINTKSLDEDEVTRFRDFMLP